MKKSIFLFMALAACMMFTGCDKDNEEEGKKEKGNFYLTLTCNPSADWFTYYDITASYTDIEGKKVFLILSENEGLNYSASMPLNDPRLAKSFSCKVEGTLKKGILYDENTKVDFTSDTDVVVAIGPSATEHSLYLNKAEWIGGFGMRKLNGLKFVSFIEKDSNKKDYFINFDYTRE